VPGRPLPADGDCSAPTLPPNLDGGGGTHETLLMPLSVRAYRVNGFTGNPVLEEDPDGSAGPAAYQPLAQDIERIPLSAPGGTRPAYAPLRPAPPRGGPHGPLPRRPRT